MSGEDQRGALVSAINSAVLCLLMDRGDARVQISVAEQRKMQARYEGALSNLERSVRAQTIEDAKEAIEDLD